MSAGKGWICLTKWRVGDLVELDFIHPGKGRPRHKKKGKITQVCRRFVVVQCPHFTECVWTDYDASNNVEIRRVSGD